jgi:hypothetical protein
MSAPLYPCNVCAQNLVHFIASTNVTINFLCNSKWRAEWDERLQKDYNRFLLTSALFCGFGIVKQDWSLRIKKELSRVRNVLGVRAVWAGVRGRKEAVLLMGHETFDHLLYTSLIINCVEGWRWGEGWWQDPPCFLHLAQMSLLFLLPLPIPLKDLPCNVVIWKILRCA